MATSAHRIGQSLTESKRMPEGRARRVHLLRDAGFELSDKTLREAATDGVGTEDVLDAYAACWTAGRIRRREGERLGEDPEVDSRGLRMEMWF